MKIGGIKPKRLFGSVLVEGNYGGGKTFFVEDEIYDLTWNNPNYFVISNIPLSRADRIYNSKNDWDRILDHLYNYFAISNSHLKDLGQYKNILVIMDECHLYYPARGAMSKGKQEEWLKLNTVLTQCRKRNVKFYFITQRVQKVDIEFRRLSEFIYYLNFDRFFGLPFNKLSVIRAGGGLSDLIGEDGTTWESVEDLEKDVIYSGYAKHNTFYFRKERKLLHPDRPLWKEKHLTNYICGISPVDGSGFIDESGEFHIDRSVDLYTEDFDSFYKGLFKPLRDVPLKCYKNQDGIPVLTFGYKSLDYENKVVKTYL